MWGDDPAESTFAALELFQKHGHRKILVPGFGYGRNAKVFLDQGLNVTGIEISETAIELAGKQLGDSVRIHHGSVGDMPFDTETYDGIFCYALIHLLNAEERAKLISDCYNQLREGGHMVFVAISTGTPTFGQGEQIGENWFRTPHGVELFYYDLESIQKEFGGVGLMEVREISEQGKNVDIKASQKFWVITGEKDGSAC